MLNNLRKEGNRSSYDELIRAWGKISSGCIVQITSSFATLAGGFDFFATVDDVSLHCIATGRKCAVIGLVAIADFGPDLDPDPEAGDGLPERDSQEASYHSALAKLSGYRRLGGLRCLVSNSNGPDESSEQQVCCLLVRAKDRAIGIAGWAFYPLTRMLVVTVVYLMLARFGGHIVTVVAIIHHGFSLLLGCDSHASQVFARLQRSLPQMLAKSEAGREHSQSQRIAR
jgi:hypothetical protein